MELKEPINFRQLLEKPLMFTLKNSTNFGDEALLEEDADEVPEIKTTPWLQSFDELKQTMTQIPNNKIFKRIINEGNGEVLGRRKCHIQWSYSTFFENEKNSYDSSFLGSTSVKSTPSDEILQGIFFALETMRKGEESHFIIDHTLMYGTHGIITGRIKIKPKADVLLIVKLIDFHEIGSEAACEQLSNDELRQFRLVKEKAIEMQLKASDFSRKHLYSHAIRVNLEIIQRILFCDIENEDEIDDKTKLLADIYAKLIDCYIKVEDYKRAHSMVNDLRKISDVDQNVNVLVNESIALGKIDDDYKRSIELLRKAQKIDPHNERVNNVLADMQKAHDKYQKDTKSFFQKAFQSKPQPRAKASDEKDKGSITEIIKSFGNIDIGSDIPLIGYTANELKKIEAAIKDDPTYRLQVIPDAKGQLKYSIKKFS